MGIEALKAAGWPGLSSAALALHGIFPSLTPGWFLLFSVCVLQLLWGMVPAAAGVCVPSPETSLCSLEFGTMMCWQVRKQGHTEVENRVLKFIFK